LVLFNTEFVVYQHCANHLLDVDVLLEDQLPQVVRDVHGLVDEMFLGIVEVAEFACEGRVLVNLIP
jgi:hypothetical protein